MQHKLQSRTDCKNTVKGNPIKLLDAMLEHSVSYMENKHHVSIAVNGVKNFVNLRQIYHVSIVVNGIKNFINLRQKEDKSLVDHTCQFKAAMKVMESHIGGDLALHKLAKLDPKCMDNYDPTKDPPELAPKECQKRAYLCMENAEWTEHGSPLTALSSQ